MNGTSFAFLIEHGDIPRYAEFRIAWSRPSLNGIPFNQLLERPVVSTYFFPILLVIPDFEEPECSCGRFAIRRRLWETSTFDLATLATKHKLHLPYQLMDVLLGSCNSEIVITDIPDLTSALTQINILRLCLYLEDISPFLAPFVATHSINDYSGINSRDSETLRPKLPEGLQKGLTSDSGTVEAWPVELALQCVRISDADRVGVSIFERAAKASERWVQMEKQHPVLSFVRDAAVSAPQLHDRSQSVLHLWCALEALFPRVKQELSFRLALCLAQMNSSGPARRTYFDRVKSSYNTRSKITHGSSKGVGHDDWIIAWGILMDTCRSLLNRGEVTDEDALLASMFA